MKLVVGLGNPGDEYKDTRHNIGFFVLDNYLGQNVKWKNRFDGLYYEKLIEGEKVIFLKPQLYMNLSGRVVKKYVDYYKISLDDILVINDDLDLDMAVYRLRSSGSCGGHNGLKDIERYLGSKDYKRLKIGIANDKEIDTCDYVLGKFSYNEKVKLENILPIVNNIIDDFFVLEFTTLMNKYNHKQR